MDFAAKNADTMNSLDNVSGGREPLGFRLVNYGRTKQDKEGELLPFVGTANGNQPPAFYEEAGGMTTIL
jgi:hypothetical protein